MRHCRWVAALSLSFCIFLDISSRTVNFFRSRRDSTATSHTSATLNDINSLVRLVRLVSGLDDWRAIKPYRVLFRRKRNGSPARYRSSSLLTQIRETIKRWPDLASLRKKTFSPRENSFCRALLERGQNPGRYGMAEYPAASTRAESTAPRLIA